MVISHDHPPEKRAKWSRQVEIRNVQTGERKTLKTGPSVVLFFFSNFFGIPLFLRKLYLWAWIAVAIDLVAFLNAFFVPDGDAERLVTNIINIGALAFCAYLSSSGNALTLKNYQKNGWVIASDPIPSPASEALWEN